MVSGSISLPSPGFFSPFPHGTCPLSVIRSVFSLGEWSPQIPTRFHVPRGTQDTASLLHTFRLQDYHPLRSAFPCLFSYMCKMVLTRSYNPQPTTQSRLRLRLRSRYKQRITKIFFLLCLYLNLNLNLPSVVGWVWALPPSLAATKGISFDFFSSAY